MSFSFCTLFDGLGGLVAVGGPVGLTSLLSQEKSCDYSSCYNPASFVGSNQSVYGTVNTCARVGRRPEPIHIHERDTFCFEHAGCHLCIGQRDLQGSIRWCRNHRPVSAILYAGQHANRCAT